MSLLENAKSWKEAITLMHYIHMCELLDQGDCNTEASELPDGSNMITCDVYNIRSHTKLHKMLKPTKWSFVWISIMQAFFVEPFGFTWDVHQSWSGFYDRADELGSFRQNTTFGCDKLNVAFTFDKMM